MSESADCEVKVKGEWITQSLDEARNLSRQRELRCPECHGRIRFHEAASDGSMKAHFEHYRGHEGCSRGSYFKGIRSPHPKALK